MDLFKYIACLSEVQHYFAFHFFTATEGLTCPSVGGRSGTRVWPNLIISLSTLVICCCFKETDSKMYSKKPAHSPQSTLRHSIWATSPSGKSWDAWKIEGWGGRGEVLSSEWPSQFDVKENRSSGRWRFILKIFMCHYFISSSLHVDKEIGIWVLAFKFWDIKTWQERSASYFRHHSHVFCTVRCDYKLYFGGGEQAADLCVCVKVIITPCNRLVCFIACEIMGS